MRLESPNYQRSVIVSLLSLVAAAILPALAFLLFIPGSKTLSSPVELPEGIPLRAHMVINAQGPFYIGDLIPVDLVIEGKPGTNYLLPELKNDQLGDLELAAKGKVKKEVSKNGWRHIATYQLVGWQTGEHPVAELTIYYQDASGKKGSIKTNRLSVKISSILPSNLSEAELLADGLKSPKKPVGLPPQYHYLWFLLGGFMLVGLVYLLGKHWKVRQPKADAITEETKIIEPAHLIALRRLEDLKQKQLLEKGEFKLFYDQLSDIAREYLENRFQIRALEMTTEEFLISLATVDFLRSNQKRALQEFLQYSDLVKFAKHQPLREEGDRALMIIHTLVEETKEQIASEEQVS